VQLLRQRHSHTLLVVVGTADGGAWNSVDCYHHVGLRQAIQRRAVFDSEPMPEQEMTTIWSNHAQQTRPSRSCCNRGASWPP
jgi:hypothetical protein